MSDQRRLVTADTDRPLREAGLFVAVTAVLASAANLPLLAAEQGWIEGPLPPGLPVLGILSPGIAAVLVRLTTDGADGVRALLGGLTRWRVGRAWWGVTLALPPAFALVLAGGAVALGQDFTPDPLGTLSELGGAIVLLVLVSVLLAAGEELGWRGHLLPLLQARLSALGASLVVGVVWAAWHVPVFYGAGIDGLALWLRLGSIVAGAVMYTWLFNNTGGSVLAVTLLHAGTNLWGPLLAPKPAVHPAATVFAAENLLIAVAVVAVYGAATLTGGAGSPRR